MPTGYTHSVQDGKVTELKEYALSCARAFGANIMMRDDPSDAPIKEYEPSSFYKDNLEQAEKRLVEIRAMDEQECDDQAEKEYNDELERRKRVVAERNEHRTRYYAMLAKVRAW